MNRNYIDILNTYSLFNGLDEEELSRLADALDDPKLYPPGEIIAREGESADCFFLIMQGSVEILKKEPDSDTQHRLRILAAGDTVGEILLLDPGTRSATVQTLEPTQVLVIPFALLHNLSGERRESLEARIKLNVASTLGERLRQTSATTVNSLMETLEETKKRVALGDFVGKMLLAACLYIYVLGIIGSAKLPNSSYATVPLVIVWLAFFIQMLKNSAFPLKVYGITLENWLPITLEALKFTLFAAGVVVLFKIGLIKFVPEYHHLPVFDLASSKNMSTGQLVFAIAIYGLFVAPVEEVMLRGGMQGPLQLLLTSRHKHIMANLLTSVVFSALHIHMSVSMALVTLPVALFWGWVFFRQNSVIGPAISHTLLGLFAFFVVGLPFV